MPGSGLIIGVLTEDIWRGGAAPHSAVLIHIIYVHVIYYINYKVLEVLFFYILDKVRIASSFLSIFPKISVNFFKTLIHLQT